MVYKNQIGILQICYYLPVPTSTLKLPKCFKNRPHTVSLPPFSPIAIGQSTLPAPSSQPIGQTLSPANSGAALIYPGSTVFMVTRRVRQQLAASVSVIMLRAAFDMFVCTCLPFFALAVGMFSKMPSREDTLTMYAWGVPVDFLFYSTRDLGGVVVAGI